MQSPLAPVRTGVTIGKTLPQGGGCDASYQNVRFDSSRTTVNQAGLYFFTAIVPGQYRLVVESSGMQKFDGALTVQVQQSAVVDAVLKVGQTATEVSIEDVTPQLSVDSPTLSHVLERQRIEQLPINGRFLTALLLTVPGMEEETEYDSVAARGFGMRRGSTEYTIDGAPITDRLMGGVFRRPVGLDTVQEFRVENNVSSAKLARPTTVIISTKSGTNSFHGSVSRPPGIMGLRSSSKETPFQHPLQRGLFQRAQPPRQSQQHHHE